MLSTIYIVNRLFFFWQHHQIINWHQIAISLSKYVEFETSFLNLFGVMFVINTSKSVGFLVKQISNTLSPRNTWLYKCSFSSLFWTASFLVLSLYKSNAINNEFNSHNVVKNLLYTLDTSLFVNKDLSFSENMLFHMKKKHKTFNNVFVSLSSPLPLN